MTEKIKLTKNGFEFWKWDNQTRNKHKLKKQPDGSVIVFEKETKEEVARYSSMEEAEGAYWSNVTEDHRSDDPFWITQFRENLEIEEGVTLDHLINAIKEHNSISTTCDVLFGDWEKTARSRISGPVELYCEGEISPELQLVFNHCINKLEFPPNSPAYITTSNEFKIKALDIGGDWKMSMLDVFQALFYSGEKEPMYFCQDEGELRLRWATGEEVDEPMAYLLHPVYLLEPTTINNLFQWVEKYDSLVMFFSLYSWCHQIEAFHTEASLPPEAADLEVEDHCGKLTRATVTRRVKQGKVRGSDPYINSWIDFECYGEPSQETKDWCNAAYRIVYNTPKSKNNTRVIREDEGATSEEEARRLFLELGIKDATIEVINYIERKECPHEERYGVMFTPAYHYSHLPFTISEECVVIKDAMYSRKGNITKPAEVKWTGESPLSLLELLDAIYWEISFAGGPEIRDDTREEMSQRADEAIRFKNEEEGRRTKTFKSWEEYLDYDDDDDDDPDGPYDAYVILPDGD